MQPHDQIARPPAHHAMDRRYRALLYHPVPQRLTIHAANHISHQPVTLVGPMSSLPPPVVPVRVRSTSSPSTALTARCWFGASRSERSVATVIYTPTRRRAALASLLPFSIRGEP